jgi:hypothetical protein
MRICRLGLVILAACAGLTAQPPGRNGPPGWGSRIVGAEAGRPGPVVKNAPFSADIVTEFTQSLPGNRISQTTTARFYRDSEGRTRREQSLSGLGALAPNSDHLPPVIFINDPVAGVNYALSPSDHTASKSGGRGSKGGGRSGGPPPGPSARGPQRQNPRDKNESLGRRNVEGVPADGTRITTTYAAGEIGNDQPILVIRESWYSPDLQVNVLTKITDPRSGDTTTKYTNISRTEPAHALFELPPDYKLTEPPGFRPR